MEPVSDPRIYSNRYEVTHLIARGGMALVYRAQDLLLNRSVALKILYPELGADPLFVERFRREAQAAANLSHPNIVPVFDWGEDNGTYFIVMELVDGTSLADILRGGRTQTASRSAQIVAQVAAALGYAHRSGVVHRDVKPGNILITSDGQVKVTDFGIAQAVASEDHLAEEGLVMGTATYFSPEQAEGAAVDGRSDVYSLGIVLFEMLVGRPPFIGDTPVAVSSQHVHGSVPPLSEFNDSVPRDLEAIVMQALAKSPAQRYQTADQFRADLLRFSEGQPVQAGAYSGAFFGDDATRSVTAVTPGDRTQAVPVMTGPRTDVRRRRNNTTGVVAAVIVILLALGGLAYALVGGLQSGFSMPDEVGRSVATATATLTSDGLTVVTTKAFSSESIGTVLSTDPKAGVRVLKGQTVTLQLSKGPQGSPVSVPDLTKFNVSTAESMLTQLGLGYHPVFTPNAPIGAIPDTVLSQSPVAGSTAHTGDIVRLTILAPGTKYAVPPTVNDTTVQAASVLGEAGLTVSPTTSSVCSNSVPSGQVVNTNPAAGQLVTAGSAVELITSSGYCMKVVPTVIGRGLAAATNILKAQGFVLGQSTTSTNPNCTPSSSGFVDSQSVPGGSSAPYNSAIDVTVCP